MQKTAHKKLTCAILATLCLGSMSPLISTADAASLPTTTQETMQTVKASTISHVFGDGSHVTDVVLEYPSELKATTLNTNAFTIPDQKIAKAYTNAAPEAASTPQTGRYVILELAYQSTANDRPLPSKPKTDRNQTGDSDAPRQSTRTVPNPLLTVTQNEEINLANGRIISPRQLIATEAAEPDIEAFHQYVYTQPGTGYQMDYSLYLPDGYDGTKKYPLVVFIPDASANINYAKMPLVQGNGATVWTSAAEQAKHPCIVLALQYSADLVRHLGMMTTDEHHWTPGLQLAADLIMHIRDSYQVDQDRIYGTGQSQGGMANIAISDRYPELFAAQYLVACQWDTQEMAALKSKNLWIVVCEGDNKAFPGMNDATALWQQLGTQVSIQNGWDSHAQPEEWDYLTQQQARTGAKINYTTFSGGNHMYTWSFAYNLTGIRDWLFSKSLSGQPTNYIYPPEHQPLNKAARQAMRDGLQALVAKDYPTAIQKFHQADKAGDFKAGRYIGLCHANGWGTKKSPQLAADWYERAANLGDITSAYYLGKCYEQGEGREQSYDKALYWYDRSAARGDKISAPAMLALAEMYSKGHGVPINSDKARYYRDKAAKSTES